MIVELALPEGGVDTSQRRRRPDVVAAVLQHDLKQLGGEAREAVQLLQFPALGGRCRSLLDGNGVPATLLGRARHPPVLKAHIFAGLACEIQ